MAISFDTITNFFLPSALAKLAANFTKAEEEFEKIVYRDGSAEMQAELDMNGFRVINHGTPVDDNDLVTLAQVNQISKGPKGDPGDGIATVMAPGGSSLVGWAQLGTGAISRTVQDKLREAVISVMDYGAAGTGLVDDTTNIQAAIDANKGKTIVFPAGKTFLAAGVSLSGSSYNGTKLLIEGTFKLKARANSSDWNWDVTGSPTYNGIILHDCQDVTVDVPGWMDGNRTNQPSSAVSDQQCHCLQLRGVRNFSIPRFNGKEVKGDGIVITSKTNVTPLTTNSKNGFIGPVLVINTADDGRNAISVVSCENLQIAGGTSVKVGCQSIGGDPMPGGLDIEPDGNWHLVKNIVSGGWSVETAGATGICVAGAALTNDAAQDWICTDIAIAPSKVVVTTSGASGPLFRRCARVTATVETIRTGSRAKCAAVDFANFCNLNLSAKGATVGVEVGTLGYVNDSAISVQIEDHSGAGLLVIGANRTRFTGYVRGGQGAGSYGVQVSVGSRGSITQDSVIYSVDVPNDVNNSFGFQTSASITFTNCVICDCAFLGYPNFETMFGFNVSLPTRNVQGRNFASAVPANGYWHTSDIVWNTATAAGGIPGWINTTAGHPGTWKPMGVVGA